MLSLDEIKPFYPDDLHRFPSFLLREYLQHKILEIIFNSSYGNRMRFIGGTCLRIMHNNQRFSENLDFDHVELDPIDFARIADIIQSELEREGYAVEMRHVIRGAYHCYIRFPRLLFESGLTGHQEEKILIQLDSEAQHFDFEPELNLLNKFDVFANVLVTPLPILLSQKYYAILNRKRAKGRDLFDVVFLHARTDPDFRYLQQKAGITDSASLKQAILKRLESLNVNELANDVAPFLFTPTAANRVTEFPAFIEQVL